MCPNGHSIRSKYCLFMEKQNEHQLLECWIIIPQQSRRDIVLVLSVCRSIHPQLDGMLSAADAIWNICFFVEKKRKRHLDSFYVGQYLLNLACTCRLMKTFTNSFDQDQTRQYAGPDLDPNCVTLWWYSWKNVMKTINFEKKKISRRQRKCKITQHAKS